jgi:beta-lactamase regulating signal transducer with metallopeptidase domain
MNSLFMFAAHNTVVSLVFAVIVLGVTRIWRNPPVAHVLWLLVLLKLVAPPLMRVGGTSVWLPEPAPASGQIIGNEPRTGAREVGNLPRFVVRPTARTTAWAATVRARANHVAVRIQPIWNQGRSVLLGCWFGGAVLCALVVAMRIVRFERFLQGTLPASERLQRLAIDIARKLDVRDVPNVRYMDGVEVPFVWCAGHRPTIVLPMRLLCNLDDQSTALILAHELAHLRRHDHWVRAVEMIVSTFYWWNPLVWAIRGQIHQAEDLCCDAWVLRAFPGCAKRYAELVLETAESLNVSQVGERLLPASPFLRSLSLKARIEMILESRFAPSVSTRSMVAIALLAFLVLPSFVQTSMTAAWAGPSDEPQAPPARKAATPATSEFPYAVQFEQGATRFRQGDKITIDEVRGTADRFTPGNLYCIKGTYTLASHDRAMLAAFTTAKDAASGKGPYLKVQATIVNQGGGTFKLFLPMSYLGWPHVTFYPAEGGASFGGNYFGTGDSVLKQWWASEKTGQESTRAPGSSNDGALATSRNPDHPATSEFPYAVRFEQGATRFLKGDKITIDEVRGTADRFKPGETCRIKGTYSLASHDRAILAAYTTAMDAENGTGTTHKVQSTVVDRGDGTFTLYLPMSCRGWPHVSFYPAGGGGDFGGIYFGTGESVLKRWWGSKEAD